MCPSPDLDESILSDFLRFHFIDEHPKEKRINQTATPPIKLLQRLWVSFGNQAQEACVFSHLQRFMRIVGMIFRETQQPILC